MLCKHSPWIWWGLNIHTGSKICLKASRFKRRTTISKDCINVAQSKSNSRICKHYGPHSRSSEKCHSWLLIDKLDKDIFTHSLSTQPLRVTSTFCCLTDMFKQLWVYMFMLQLSLVYLRRVQEEFTKLSVFSLFPSSLCFCVQWCTSIAPD